MVLTPTAVFAEEDKNLYELSYENIQKEMKNRSPAVESMWERVYDLSSNLDTSKLKESLEKIDGEIMEAVVLRGTYEELSGNTGDDNNKKGNTGDSGASENGLLGDGGEENGSSGGNGEQTIAPDGYYAMMVSAYEAIIANLTMTKMSLEANIEALEAQRDNLWKSYLQVEQSETQIIQGVQSLFLSYFNLLEQRGSLADAVEIMESQLKVSKISESLGLGTSYDTLKLEIQLKEQKRTLNDIDKTLEDMIGSINLMLGQDYDVNLTLLEAKAMKKSLIRNIDYDEDLEEALKLSYDVRLADKNNDREQAERQFTFAFHQAYQNLKDKLKALELAEEKLEYEKIFYDLNELKHSLGLMSKLEFEGNSLTYQN
ncbi:MAG: TolC family protein [Desulfitobacterium sp.]|nr:TolC family protein [Desulfitobacterium sp.]